MGEALWSERLDVRAASVGLKLLLGRAPYEGRLGRALENATQAQALAAVDAVLARPERADSILDRLVARRAAPIVVIGDSHSRLLVRRGRLEDRRFLAPIHLFCSGGSARGLGNPASRAGYGPQVAALLRRVEQMRSGVPVMLHFGQVDVEFVHPFGRLAAGGEGFDPVQFERFCSETVDRYVQFLTRRVTASRRPMTIVSGVFPPTLTDAAWRRGYVNAHLAQLHGVTDADALSLQLRALHIPSQPERTEQHRGFNVALAQAATANGFRYVDDGAALIGAGGVVAPEWLGAAGARITIWTISPFERPCWTAFAGRSVWPAAVEPARMPAVIKAMRTRAR